MPIAALCGSLHHHQCIFVAERDCRAESVYAASAAFGRFLKVRKMNDNVAVVVVIGGCNSTPPSLGVTATVTVRSDDDHERREVLGATRKEYNTSAAVEIATQQPQRQTTTSNETTATSSTPPPSANEPPSPSCASVKTGSPSGPYIASTTFLVRVMEGQERHGRHVRLPDNIDSGTIWVELASYLYDSAPTPYIIKFEQGCVCMDHPLTTFVFEELCRRSVR
ncbi:Hypothetical protein, putative [Bodo saltans]|uniref:Uncharacterized protein n=1 Tax=Bodo saltans TaxID=75058 RepID=A0A0S4IKY0_BODSA|nr:Hypothetical protein, putative [Bodo saltans]|eukprot:CUF15787.1 Hypothetical protein, putative [Bodo saltans]